MVAPTSYTSKKLNSLENLAARSQRKRNDSVFIEGRPFLFSTGVFGETYTLVLEEENLRRKVFRNVTSLPLTLTMWLLEMIVFSV